MILECHQTEFIIDPQRKRDPKMRKGGYRRALKEHVTDKNIQGGKTLFLVSRAKLRDFALHLDPRWILKRSPNR